MNLKQVATLLSWPRESVKTAIEVGITPPGATAPILLAAVPVGRDFEVEDADLQHFIDAFEVIEPGRHPPLAVRRKLLLEAREQCCIDGSEGPLEFHHILDWGKLKHHDPSHMMVLCRNCHGKCTAGQIDVPRQRFYKANPHWRQLFAPSVPGNIVTWEDLRVVVTELHSQHRSISRSATEDGRDPRHDYNYVDIERKNELNRLSAEYFATWREGYEPKIFKVKEFLGDSRNDDVRELYYDIVGDLRAEIATIQGREPNIAFDEVLRSVFEAAFAAFYGGPRVNRETLRTVVAFMYFECDIGRKD